MIIGPAQDIDLVADVGVTLWLFGIFSSGFFSEFRPVWRRIKWCQDFVLTY
jgi:hypothetical protein